MDARVEGADSVPGAPGGQKEGEPGGGGMERGEVREGRL